MDAKLLTAQIKKMDRTSDEFAELFHAVNEMYFTFDDPDEFQKQAALLNLILHKGEDWMIEALGKIGHQLFECVTKDVKATHGMFNTNGKDYFFDLYQDKEALSAVHKLFRNAVIHKAQSHQD